MDELLLQIEAKIQNRIADFLYLKSKILAFQGVPNPEIQGEAATLMGKQTFLEDKLREALNSIDALKQGGFDWSNLSDISTLTMFYADMEKQIGDVNDLEERVNKFMQTGQYVPAGVFTNMTPVMIAGAAILGIYFLSSRKK